MNPWSERNNKLAESLRADNYSEGTALYSGKRGQRILSQKLSVSDIKNDPARHGTKPFDYEGTVAGTPALKLIENGTIVNLISDLKHEKRYGIPTTANCFRGYNSTTGLKFSNLVIEPGQRSFREILKDAGEVIVSVMAFGGDYTADGGFSTPIQLAFLAKDGVIQGRLPPMAMNSRIDRMFGTELLEVASDGSCPGETDPYVLAEMDIQLT